MKDQIPFFSVLHNELEPTGNLGRGTHYSVFRSVSWLDDQLIPQKTPFFHDFGVVWDEDHDTRILDVITKVYLEGLLSPALFIGERKGALTMVVRPGLNSKFIETLHSKIYSITQSNSDSWDAYVTPIDAHEGIIIHDNEEKVSLYLKSIEMLFNLGLKPAIWDISEVTS